MFSLNIVWGMCVKGPSSLSAACYIKNLGVSIFWYLQCVTVYVLGTAMWAFLDHIRCSFILACLVDCCDALLLSFISNCHLHFGKVCCLLGVDLICHLYYLEPQWVINVLVIILALLIWFCTCFLHLIGVGVVLDYFQLVYLGKLLPWQDRDHGHSWCHHRNNWCHCHHHPVSSLSLHVPMIYQVFCLVCLEPQCHLFFWIWVKLLTCCGKPGRGYDW